MTSHALVPATPAQSRSVPNSYWVGRQQAAFYEMHNQVDLYGHNKLSGRTQALSDLKGWLLDCHA